MKIIRSASEIEASRVCVAIGFFDGVHLGHQQIVRQTVSDARQHDATSLVITFDRHPNTIVAPDRVPPLIYSLPQKLRALAGLGVDSLLLLHFDKALCEQTGETFVRHLARDCPNLRSVCVGANFVFGHKRGGNVELLRKLGSELGFSVHGLAAVSLDGRPVSSTRIRETVAAGDLDAAGQMLGRSYSLCGTVIRGEGVGRQLGFPTANMDIAGLLLPPRGVYTALAEFGGKQHHAVINIGLRPTFASQAPQIHVEAHLLDFQADLYGAEMELILLDKLRDELKFASLEELRAQIARDVSSARNRS